MSCISGVDPLLILGPKTPRVGQLSKVKAWISRTKILSRDTTDQSGISKGVAVRSLQQEDHRR